MAGHSNADALDDMGPATGDAVCSYWRGARQPSPCVDIDPPTQSSTWMDTAASWMKPASRWPTTRARPWNTNGPSQKRPKARTHTRAWARPQPGAQSLSARSHPMCSRRSATSYAPTKRKSTASAPGASPGSVVNPTCPSRAKFGETAFLDVYQRLYEAPDPAPALASALVRVKHGWKMCV